MPKKFKHSFTSANEIFADLLSDCDEKDMEENFAYRGHGDSSYQLIPSFMRDKSVLNHLRLESDAQALLADSAPFRIFYQTANQLGYSLPSVSAEKHLNYTNISSIDALMMFANHADQPRFDLDDYEIMSFAQHYGIPTPLLDWSRSPLIALYFAASDALKAMSLFAEQHVAEDRNPSNLNQKTTGEILDAKFESSSISVWRAGMNAISELNRTRELGDEDCDARYTVRFFTPRTQGNTNIVAQQGMFSIHHPSLLTFEYVHGEGNKNCLSTVIDENLKWSKGQANNSNFVKAVINDGPLHEFTLPYSEVLALMRILNRCGLHAATVFPGHKGCAERVRERAALALVSSLA
ncbi:MAG: FRG domain-containing protein [Rhodobacteraceae bacterium]|nr:FRG domain-containing protein [Paracoccaceae bacterium]